MIQIVLFFIVFIGLIFPMGRYLAKVSLNEKSFGETFFNKIEQKIYQLTRVNRAGMSWKTYIKSMMLTNLMMMVVSYIILRIQSLILMNPNKIESMSPALSFNTVISFMTNTNLQHYSGESSLSYLSQILVITMMMFTSAATGYAVASAFIRGFRGKESTLGNFYVDFTRIIIRILLPLAIIVSLLLVSQGVPQTFAPNVVAKTIEGLYQDIAMGPVASLESIKHLGTNGGGFFGANSSSPFENPTVISNMIEMWSMMLLPASLVVAFGYMIRSKKEAKNWSFSWYLGYQARPLLITMSVLFILGLSVILWSESAGNPLLAHLGVNQVSGSLEGKELRFGIEQSALFTVITTAFTTGSVNNMHDTLTPLGGAVPLGNMMLNMIFGGKGVGLMNMLLYVLLTVFICGLMIGRTPEYLGKKIEPKEMRLTALAIIVHPLLILSASALAVMLPAGISGISQPGFHGLTQVVYEFASSAANNGSGFEGLADNTLFWNISTGLVMLLGRYLPIMLQLAIAYSFLKKKSVTESVGTLQTDTPTFTVALLVIILVISALTFFPVLILGPVAEHLTLWN
ncbi:potassium-transporting ATPase subunit KdpA [Vagococcus penaei]|uniref:Potassium-transporting ATPase potassium-binding subunit n=1 Tax=Vagococcus penaei TaxID=633807 RepID=A0A1Q2D8G4_9ENTE|nr:potassium-transporting ATPase subunit KdpA [Vagococcus penaei]AQP54656.1 potassium-transporting ATPase subunit KdpA [Vagococcus penaei]RSU05308.1 potassium-transporting ATPase subunit KdpA [Vagococcus penaei]